MKKAKKKRNPKEYVVGYAGDGQCVYGPNEKNAEGVSVATFTSRLSLFSARCKLNELGSVDHDRVIYKLVPVVVVKGRKERAK